jgi:radical SAM superfamily enzyme YgiQ (UPF0313 family)
MSLKILLVSVNACATPYVVYPLGLSHVAASLVSEGHTVEMADCAADEGRLLEKVRTFAPHLIGISLRNIDDIQIRNTRYFADDLITLAATIRTASRAPLILGGSGFSLFPERLLQDSGADFGITGEGEESMVLFANAIEHDSDYRNIPGLLFREKGTIVQNAGKPCSPSSIVPPLHPPNLAQFYIKESSMLNIQTQRGCCHSCCYCTYPLIEGARVRFKNPASIGDELDRIAATKAKYFFIVDSVFNSTVDHAVAVCEEIIRRKCGMQWGCFLRPQGLTAECMEIMSRAGLSHIEFGSDSFSDSVLAEYEKNFCFDDVYLSSELARSANVHYAHFLIIGGPGESEATMRETFANSQRLKKTVHFPFVGMRVYPGTPLFRRALAESVIRPDADLLPPFFYINPTFSSQKAFSLLSEFSGISPNWIVGDIPAGNAKAAGNLRSMGIVGPLWEFLVR